LITTPRAGSPLTCRPSLGFSNQALGSA
jgi:hypothetical protein